MRIDVLTLFPEIFEPLFSHSILGRARDQGLLELFSKDMRSYATDRHRTVDDTPYGGGPGMVLRADVVGEAIADARRTDGWVVLLTPAGRTFDQRCARELAQRPHVILVCGHYEGFDERVATLVDEEVSLGDFVLTGGEAAAWPILDAVARLVPGVIQGDSLDQESFEGDLLEAPQYTRPRSHLGESVPEVLLSGDHEEIRKWRRRESLRRTWERRPDLLKKAQLSPDDRLWLMEMGYRPEKP